MHKYNGSGTCSCKKKVVDIQFENCDGVEKAGVMLSVPALLQSGLLSELGNFSSFCPGYYQLSSILLTLANCFLLRLKSIEQIAHESPGELGKAIGLDRIPEVKTLRSKINELSQDGQAKDWGNDLSKKWMLDYPELTGVLFIDGHQNPYFGRYNKIPRRYMARLRLALRGTTDYWVNDKIGQPFFRISKTVGGSMIETIKNDIIPRLEKDIPNQPTAEELSADRLLHRFMIVYDRECYSPDFMIQMWDKRMSCCTYNKYVKDNWAEDEFCEYEYQTISGKKEKVKLAERLVLIEGKESERLENPQLLIKVPVYDTTAQKNDRNGALQKKQVTTDTVKIIKKRTRKKNRLFVREVRKLTNKGHQVSILTTNFKLSILLIGVYMFARWCQENFFKYMMENFGIDFLIRYLHQEILGEQLLVNPKYRAIEKKIKSVCAKLKSLKTQFADLTLNQDQTLNQDEMEKYQKKKAEVVEEISLFNKELEELKQQKNQVPQKIQYEDLPEDQKFNAVYTDQKHFVDTIKMIVYRAETILSNTMKIYMAKPGQSKQLLQEIFQNAADLRVDLEKEIVEINIHHMSAKWKDEILEKLCKEMNETETIFPDTNLKMVFKVINK